MMRPFEPGALGWCITIRRGVAFVMTTLTSASEPGWGLEAMAAVICTPSSDAESCGLAVDPGAASNSQAADAIHIVRFAFMPDIVGEPRIELRGETEATRSVHPEPGERLRALRGIGGRAHLFRPPSPPVVPTPAVYDKSSSPVGIRSVGRTST